LNRTQDESPEAKTSTARPESTESEDGVNRAQEESTEAGTASQETDQTAPQQAAAQAGAATATRELPIQALPLVSQLNQQTETAAAPEQTVLPETQSTAPTELITSQETRLPSAGAAETANADTVPELSQAFQQQLEQITQAGENSDKGPGPAPQAALAKELGNLHPHLNPHLPEHKGPVMAPHAHIQLQSQQESELASLTLNPALIPQEPIAGNGESLRKAGEPAGILQPALGSAVGADLPKVQVNLEGAAGQFAGGFQNQQSNGSEMNFNQQDLSGVEVTIHGVGGVSEVKTTGQVTSTLSPALTKATGETVADQAVSGAQMAMAAGKKEISLNLNPENLGQLRIHLTSNGDQQVSARFVTTTLEARDQLQEQIDALRQSMEKQGIQVGQITVVMAGEESASANNKGQDAAARQNQQQQADPFQQMSQQNGSHQYQQAGRDNGGGWNQSATSSSPSGGESGAFGLNGVDSSTENGSTDGSRSTSHDNGRISLLI
jgi:flagellar hook-length control protein FliK